MINAISITERTTSFQFHDARFSALSCADNVEKAYKRMDHTRKKPSFADDIPAKYFKH